jgi:hypothetical protein
MMSIGEERIWSPCDHGRGAIAAGALVAFNLLMLVLAAFGPNPMEAPFLVAWFAGDAILSWPLALTGHS